MVEVRARVVAWRVQPVVMADDGEDLVSVPVEPVEIPAAQWEAFKAGGDRDAVLSIQEQLNDQG